MYQNEWSLKLTQARPIHHSSDMWVSFPKTTPQTTDTGTEITLRYAVGKAQGALDHLN